MAVGDYVVRRNNAVTTAIPDAGSTLKCDYDTAVANVGSGIVMTANGTFSLGETGHFLVMVSEHILSGDTVQNARNGGDVHFVLDATKIEIGRCGWYIRNNGFTDNYITSGAGIINVASTTDTGDELEIHIERIDNLTTADPTRVANDRSIITIIKLDDTEDFGMYESSGTTSSSTTDDVRTVINLVTVAEDATFTRETNTVDIATNERVLYCYSVSTENSGGRSEYHGNVELAGTAVPSSWTHLYPRTSQNNIWFSASSVGLLEPTSGNNVDVGIVSRESGGETFVATLQLMTLPAGLESIIVEATTGDYNPTSATDFVWDTEKQKDGGAFAHTAPEAAIDVLNTGDYIVMSAQADATAAGTAVTRGLPAARIRVQGVDTHFAGTSYCRNNNTADHSGSHCAGLVTGLSVNDSIVTRNIAENATGAIACSAGALTVIRLSSMFAGAPAGDIDASEAMAFSQTATLEGIGSLLGSESLDLAQTALLTGLGTLNSSESLAFDQVATGSLKGVLSGAPGITFDNLVVPSARGDLIASQAIVLTSSGNLDALGILAAINGLSIDDLATLIGRADVAASEALTFSRVATLSGQGILIGSEALIFAKTATLINASQGAIVATGNIVLSEAAIATGRGVLISTESLAFADLAALAATGALIGTDSLTFTESGLLGGLGALIGTEALILAQTGNLTGLGTLIGSEALILAQTGNLTGLGALLSSEALLFADTAVLTIAIDGSIAATESLLFNQSGLLIGRGILAGSEAFIFDQSGALSGGSPIAATEALVFAKTGTLTGTGILLGTEALAFEHSGLLVGRGALAGSEAIVLSQTGLLIGLGTLAGTSPTVFAETGILTGTGTLNAAELLVFFATGTSSSTNPIVVLEALAFNDLAVLSQSNALAGTATLVFSAVINTDIGGVFNAVEYFIPGQNVTITLYDPISGAAIPLSSDTCKEIPGQGVYIWEVSNLLNQPNMYQEYGYKMTDGSTFKSGIV